MLLIIITALIPVVVLLWYIYVKDSAHPEPLSMLIKALLYGVGAGFVTLIIGNLLQAAGLLVNDLGSLTGAISTALFAAALPEECSKLLMLWLLLRKNKFFDEYMDGIVYGACIGLGFAGLENIMYLLSTPDWMMTGIIRGLTAVPAHFAMGCAMGYFYSEWHFGKTRQKSTAVSILAVPVLIHWAWDALAFSGGLLPYLSVFLNVLFFFFIYKLYQSTQKHIAAMQQKDHQRDVEKTMPPLPKA